MMLEFPVLVGIISLTILTPHILRSLIMVAKRSLTWDELAIRVICRAKSKREETELLKRLDEAASKGRKSVKLPKHILA